MKSATPQGDLVDPCEHDVIAYLKADRAVFVNSQFLLQLDEGTEQKKRHLWIDALAVDLRNKEVLLCEVSIARNPAALLKRIGMLCVDWSAYRQALWRDASIPVEWSARFRAFVPRERVTELLATLRTMLTAPCPLTIDIVPLEEIAPWKYCYWKRSGEVPFHSLVSDDLIQPAAAKVAP
jgi:hypothetical protein